jgi:four helix bundle protein
MLVKEIYSWSSGGSPISRDFGFRDQIQRASVSIMNNIAEGFTRGSNPDFARFLDMARGSCGEVCSMLYAAEDLNYISGENAAKLREMTSLLIKGISSLTAHLRKSKK